MAIDRTAANLATFCLQVVGTSYWMGCYGQRASRALYNQKKADYSQYYPPKSWTEASFVKDFGNPVTDCVGLYKWFLWAKSMEDKTPIYNASEDWGSNTLWNKCKEKGKINTLPSNKIGLGVFKVKNGVRHHVGFIVDNSGTVVEAKGHAYGTVKSKASDWDEWGKLPHIKYDSVPIKDLYTVATQYDPLTVRKQPTSKSDKIGELSKGSSFVSTDIVEGEDVKGCKVWVGTSGGYVSGYYLSPTPTLPDPEPTPEPQPDPPAPEPTPAGNTYTVKVNTYLALRTGPGTGYDEVGQLFNGAKVTAVEEKNGWIRVTGDLWCSKTYLI